MNGDININNPPLPLTEELRADGYEWQLWTYTGRRLDWNSKKYEVHERWQGPPKQGETKHTVTTFSDGLLDKKWGQPVVGGVYWVCTQATGTITKCGGDYKPYYLYREDNDDISGWVAMDRSCTLTAQSRTAANRAARRDVIKEALEPIRKLMYKVPRAQKRQIIADVLDALYI